MGTFKFSLYMLKKEYKKSIFYVTIMIVAIAMCYIFMNLMNIESLQTTEIAQGSLSWTQMYIPFDLIITFFIIFLCCFMILYANNFYITRKKKELSIISFSGCNAIGTTLYIIYQTVVLMLIAIPVGLALGALAIPIVNIVIFNYLGLHDTIFSYSLMGVAQTCILIITLLVVLFVFSGGHIYRQDVHTLMGDQTSSGFSIQPVGKSSWLYSILYIGGIAMMLVSEHQASAYVVPTMVGVFGIIGIVKKTLPNYIRKWKLKTGIAKPYSLIYISNVAYTFQQSSGLVGLLATSVTFLVAIVAGQKNNPGVYITSLVGYVVIVVLLMASLLFKYCMEVQSRKVLFQAMWKIGYTKTELKTMIKKEIVWYYLLVLLLPLAYIVLVIGFFMYHKELSLGIATFMLGGYSIPLLIAAIITYRAYQKSVLTPIVGGTNNE